jgi:eukaryotic-like serine/threonine-protein kinase
VPSRAAPSINADPDPGAVPGARRLAGRYRLESVLGRGSMGTVWAATDEVLHRPVAIKQINVPPGLPAGEVARLRERTMREARAVAALSSPYVVTVFDVLTPDAGPVIVMELFRGRSLADVIRDVGRLTDGQAATVGVAVASALRAAHAAGITHRDVKPANVLIGVDGGIKLTDFGVARSSAEPTITGTGMILGSAAYLAPEVATGTPVGPLSDAWSLGGLLFACVEGRPPFDRGTPIATVASVVKDPVPAHPHAGRLGRVISGLLLKTPGLRMRLDRALPIMQAVADDPSGTHLTTSPENPSSRPDHPDRLHA